jgi:hypothetical protein
MLPTAAACHATVGTFHAEVMMASAYVRIRNFGDFDLHQAGMLRRIFMLMS